MMEVGPWRVNGHGGLDAKEGGWEEYANVVYGARLSLLVIFRAFIDASGGCSGPACRHGLFIHKLKQICFGTHGRAFFSLPVFEAGLTRLNAGHHTIN